MTAAIFILFIIKLILFVKLAEFCKSLVLSLCIFFSMLEELVCSLGEGLHKAGISCLALDEVHIVCCGSLAVK